MNDDEAPEGLDEATARLRIAKLRVEHEDLDAAIEALEGRPSPDQIRIARFKKKKLVVRDEMVRLEDQITPDIIA